jgi:hypothetical protein
LNQALFELSTPEVSNDKFSVFARWWRAKLQVD